MSFFAIFDHAPWDNPTGYIISDRPWYPRKHPGAFVELDAFVWPDETWYAVIGTPSDFDCIVICLEIPSGKVVGYDLRFKMLIYGHSYGMGMQMDLTGTASLNRILGVCSEVRRAVNRVPTETDSSILEWLGGGFKPRECIYRAYVPTDLTHEFYNDCISNNIHYIAPHAGRDYVELWRPNFNKLMDLVDKGWEIWKDWTKIQPEDRNKGYR
jgi:hypothetical protein